MAYTPDSIWRNRDTFLRGRDEIEAFLTQKWARENGYRLRKELFSFSDNKIAVQFWYEFHDAEGQWWRCYGLEDWTFADDGLMRKRQSEFFSLLFYEVVTGGLRVVADLECLVSGNDVKISEEERWYKDGVDVNTVPISEKH